MHTAFSLPCFCRRLLAWAMEVAAEHFAADQAEGEVGLATLAPATYAVVPFRGSEDEIATAYEGFYGGWLPDSGWQPLHRPPLEVYRNEPDADPEGIHELEIWIAVKPL